jgi:hypothetical protein
MRVILTVLIPSIFLFGCSVQPTKEGSTVRTVTAQEKAKCSSLGILTSTMYFGLGASHQTEGAINKLKNEVASRGGDAVLIMNIQSSDDYATVTGEALNCNIDGSL